jgi:phage shock protein C
MAHDSWQPAHGPHRLRRSTRERMWAGVAGGLAEYFDVDPVLMRLICVVATVVTAGLFVAVYIVMWVIMPLDTDLPASDWKEPPAGAPEAEPMSAGSMASDAAGAWDFGAPDDWHRDPSAPYGWRRDRWRGDYRRHSPRRRRSAGLVLVALGLLFLGSQAGVFRWINWSVAWAVVLIVVGAALLLRNTDWRP